MAQKESVMRNEKKNEKEKIRKDKTWDILRGCEVKRDKWIRRKSRHTRTLAHTNNENNSEPTGSKLTGLKQTEYKLFSLSPVICAQCVISPLSASYSRLLLSLPLCEHKLVSVLTQHCAVSHSISCKKPPSRGQPFTMLMFAKLQRSCLVYVWWCTVLCGHSTVLPWNKCWLSWNIIIISVTLQQKLSAVKTAYWLVCEVLHWSLSLITLAVAVLFFWNEMQ